MTVCVCGHPELSHNLTRQHRRTYCTVADPQPCGCITYREDTG